MSESLELSRFKRRTRHLDIATPSDLQRFRNRLQCELDQLMHFHGHKEALDMLQDLQGWVLWRKANDTARRANGSVKEPSATTGANGSVELPQTLPPTPLPER